MHKEAKKPLITHLNLNFLRSNEPCAVVAGYAQNASMKWVKFAYHIHYESQRTTVTIGMIV
jgi:hypothetical protein